jgi:hypothetical protein
VTVVDAILEIRRWTRVVLHVDGCADSGRGRMVGYIGPRLILFGGATAFKGNFVVLWTPASAYIST